MTTPKDDASEAERDRRAKIIAADGLTDAASKAVELGQEFSGYASQMRHAEGDVPRLILGGQAGDGGLQTMRGGQPSPGSTRMKQRTW